MEGNGIYYHINGYREMGKYLNGEKVGRHVKLEIIDKLLQKYINY